MNVSEVIEYLTERAQEPSTAASVAAILAVAGVAIDPGSLQNILLGFAAVAGLFGFGLPEKK